jgi:hypothetical protein
MNNKTLDIQKSETGLVWVSLYKNDRKLWGVPFMAEEWEDLKKQIKERNL